MAGLQTSCRHDPNRSLVPEDQILLPPPARPSPSVLSSHSISGNMHVPCASSEPLKNVIYFPSTSHAEGTDALPGYKGPWGIWSVIRSPVGSVGWSAMLTPRLPVWSPHGQLCAAPSLKNNNRKTKTTFQVVTSISIHSGGSVLKTSCRKHPRESRVKSRCWRTLGGFQMNTFLIHQVVPSQSLTSSVGKPLI